MRGWTFAMALALCLSSTASSFGATFSSSWIRFEMPPRWRCELQDGEWSCQTIDAAHQRESIIVFAAKNTGSDDTLAAYRTHLSTPRHWQIKGHDVVSRVIEVKDVTVRGQVWVDARIEDAEIEGFTTRYFATVKGDVAALVTFSVRTPKYPDYRVDLDNLLKSLRVKPPGTVAADER